MELPQSEKQENTMARENTPPRCSCFTIVFFSVLAIGAVSGLSLVFTGSSNPLDYFVPVDPPGEKDAFRWDFTAGLELMVEVRLHDKKKKRNPATHHLTNLTFSHRVLTIFRMHVTIPGQLRLTNLLQTGTLANL